MELHCSSKRTSDFAGLVSVKKGLVRYVPLTRIINVKQSFCRPKQCSCCRSHSLLFGLDSFSTSRFQRDGIQGTLTALERKITFLVNSICRQPTICSLDIVICSKGVRTGSTQLVHRQRRIPCRTNLELGQPM